MWCDVSEFYFGAKTNFHQIDRLSCFYYVSLLGHKTGINIYTILDSSDYSYH